MKQPLTGFEEKTGIEAANLESTLRIAADFAGQLHPGDLVAFYGELGSGKTAFIKAICKKLGVDQEATSPSFTIMNEYQSENQLIIYHFDFYRIEKSAELQQLGLDEFFYGESLCLVEWADRIEQWLPANRWDVTIRFKKNEPDARIIDIIKR
jgi:tRNA threonylcarbamoyladenosine biosynthesis protein TsaE